MVEKPGDSDILEDAVGAHGSAHVFRREESDKSDLLELMSHEIRTPLSAILGFAQLLESGTPALTVAQKRSIDRILQAGWHLEKLIDMTRDLALIESGALALSLEPVSLAAVMLDCQAMIEAQAQTHGVRVTFPLIATPCIVSADRNRLQQALGNLLYAMIEYSGVGGAVVVDCDTLDPERIRIGINDGGDELSTERPTRSFQPFDDVEREAAAANGAGIGLLLAKRLIELMGGAIGAESNDGNQRVFSFDLKRLLVPIATGRAATHRGWPQSTVHSPDEYARQRP